MNLLYPIVYSVLSALLWRIRGGLRIAGKKLPLNKIWYAIAFACYGCLYFSWGLENWLVGFIACYVSYQLYGWGTYISSLLTGCELNPEKDRECELIDDLLYPLYATIKGQKYYLYQFSRWFGFLGTTLTGLIITFLWGLFLGNIIVMLSGLGMGICYWLGAQLEKILPLGKAGWNWGEIICGFWFGLILGLQL